MKKFIFGLIILTSLLPGVVEAKKKPQVVIPKRIATLPTTPLQTVALLAFVAPPLLVFYDLQRRTTCMNPPDPLGLGGPGFDGKPTPPTNVMIPACVRLQPTPLQ